MSRTESIEDGFIHLRKTRDAAFLAQSGKRLAPACQNLMRIGLMSDVPYNFILRTVERPVQGKREFHRAEARRKMPARLRNRVNNFTAQFPRQLRKLVERTIFQFTWLIDVFQ